VQASIGGFFSKPTAYISRKSKTKYMEKIVEWISLVFGGIVGWVTGKFAPAFPLIVIATLFVLYDAWSAYELDKRVHIMYPKQKREKAKFVSYKFRNVIPTLTERFIIIILAYCVERWVFVHIDVPVSYIAAGVVCAEQLLSIAENKASCRLPGDKHARVWKLLAKVLIDKTARHFDVDNSILEEDLQHVESSVVETPKKRRAKKQADIEPLNSQDL
jgi:hypothetical protein